MEGMLNRPWESCGKGKAGRDAAGAAAIVPGAVGASGDIFDGRSRWALIDAGREL